MSTFVPLIDVYRGQTLECQYAGAVAVVDLRGRLLAHAGDPHWMTFTRSTLKALQALPFMQAEGPRHFGLGSRDIAMLCASHSGEAMHVAQVQNILERAGVGYQQLQCGCHVPYFVDLGVGPEPEHIDQRHHNCSGKHSGFLAYCAQHGLSMADYLEPAHPLQQAIRGAVAQVAGMRPEELRDGIDGCSAPNYAMPLSRLARAYARLASGTQDSEFGASFGPMSEAMTAHPELVSGTGRNDEAFMRAGRGDWVTKVGADGVQAVASKSRGEAFAIKIADGSKPALHAATVAVLDQLGWLDAAQAEALRPWRAEALSNWRGTVVGERRPVFELVRPAATI
jgi:L-asparaginase II